MLGNVISRAGKELNILVICKAWKVLAKVISMAEKELKVLGNVISRVGK